jgi:protein gp37
MIPMWPRVLRDQCDLLGVAFHFKQWGEYDASGVRSGVKASGRFLDGREHLAFPVSP